VLVGERVEILEEIAAHIRPKFVEAWAAYFLWR
jgi:hypothetical protein